MKHYRYTDTAARVFPSLGRLEPGEIIATEIDLAGNPRFSKATKSDFEKQLKARAAEADANHAESAGDDPDTED